MDRLTAELQRLYFFDPGSGHGREAGGLPGAFELAGPDGRARAMVLTLARAGDWEAVARLHEGVQEELELPAPAVSVSGRSGYRVWFSLAEAVPGGQARAFLEGLRRRYLAELPAAAVELHPAAGAAAVDAVPAIDAASGKWSAFIDPAMGSMFVTEPGLEMAPNLDRQADLLAGLASVGAGDFERALAALAPDAGAAGDAAAGATPVLQAVAAHGGRTGSGLSVGSGFSDPRSFLLAVMNDPSASAAQRIRAAEALLPYFEKQPAE